MRAAESRSVHGTKQKLNAGGSAVHERSIVKIEHAKHYTCPSSKLAAQQVSEQAESKRPLAGVHEGAREPTSARTGPRGLALSQVRAAARPNRDLVPQQDLPLS